MKSFLAGLSLGFGLGVLFAPMSGQEFRTTVADRAGEFADTARDSYGRVRQTAEAAIGSIRRESEDRSGTQG
jgi:gas vesicle protein